MTHLWPCRRCHRRDTCERRAELLGKLRGAGITKANVRCAIPQSDFPPGSTVDVLAFEIDVGSDGDEFAKLETVRRGIVRSWRLGKASVVLNPGQEIIGPHHDEGCGISYLKVESDRMTRIDVPIVELCRCGISTERCEEGQRPMVRNGKWHCADEASEMYP